MTYEVGKIGRKILKIMRIKCNFDWIDPAAALKVLPSDDEKSPYNSVFNPNFYPRAAAEIYGGLFTAEEQTKLQKLMAELENEEASLIQSAKAKVNETMEKYMKLAETLQNQIKTMEEGVATAITCVIFKEIPAPALNLLALIEIKQKCFPESYHFFEKMLNELNGTGGDYYTKDEVKKCFTKTLKELENLLANIKKSKQPPKPQPEEPSPSPNDNPPPNTPSPEQDPPKKQPEKDENKPDNPNENPKKPNGNNDDNLRTLKNQAISSITVALNKNPPLTNSELSSQYQDWENSINQLSDESQINSLKSGILSDIQDQRKKKTKKQTTEEVKQTINSNLQKAQNSNATIQEKKEILADNEQYEGRSVYKDTEEQIKNLKKEVAQDNPVEYRDKIVSDLTTKLKNNRLTEEELDPETKTEIEALKKETDPAKLVEKEVKITEKIGQKSAAKKIVTFQKEAERVLKSNNNAKIEELKKQLTEFIKSDNIYYQTKKEEAQQLLKQLESGLNFNNFHSSEPLPFSVQIGIGMGAVLTALFLTLIIHRKKQINFSQRRLPTRN